MQSIQNQTAITLNKTKLGVEFIPPFPPGDIPGDEDFNEEDFEMEEFEEFDWDDEDEDGDYSDDDE